MSKETITGIGSRSVWLLLVDCLFNINLDLGGKNRVLDILGFVVNISEVTGVCSSAAFVMLLSITLGAGGECGVQCCKCLITGFMTVKSGVVGAQGSYPLCDYVRFSG